MKLKKATPEDTEDTVPLSKTEPGDCVRFAHDSLEDAFKCDLFWMRVDNSEGKDKDRVLLVNLKDGSRILRDGVHRVIVEPAALHIG